VTLETPPARLPRSQRVRAPLELVKPSPRHQLTWRALNQDDAAQIASLLASDEDAQDSVDPVPPLFAGLDQDEIGQPGDTLGGFDEAGVLRACSAVFLWPGVDGTILIHGVVDPAWGGRGIGRAMMAWQEGRSRQILASLPGDGPARIVCYVDESAANRRRLAMAAGFAPIRSMYKMRRDLEAPIQCNELPGGFAWRTITRVDPEEVREAHNTASGDGWAPGPIYRQLWDKRWPQYSPTMSWVVRDSASGRIAGYALCLADLQPWQLSTLGEALIHRIAVLPEFRNRGLGRAILSRTLFCIADEGPRFASTLFDPAMAHSGLDMNQAFGFSPARRVIVYGLDL
jgi:GNAT superfamily N-acetyltransferase